MAEARKCCLSSLNWILHFNDETELKSNGLDKVSQKSITGTKKAKLQNQFLLVDYAIELYEVPQF